MRGVSHRDGAKLQPEARMAEGRVEFLGRGSEPPLHQLGGLGERCKLPKQGMGI